MSDIRIVIDEVKFDVRVAGILKKEDQILVSRETDGVHTLPGGAVMIGETSEEAIIREFFEETNLVIQVEKLLQIEENFFVCEGQKQQQMLFVYQVSLVSDVPQNLIGKEGPQPVWFPISKNIRLKPDSLNQLLLEPTKYIQHVIENEER